MARDNRPNILWISFEDTNPLYGCYGDPVNVTPNVDSLAAQGCRWPNTFSTCGVCAPARSAIITGMYPTSVGTHHMRTTHANRDTPEMPTPYSAVLPHYVKCFTEYLRGAGYYCTNNVKTDYQFTPPVTAWDELSVQAHWRNRREADQPFFAVFNNTVTHESGMWPQKGLEPTVDPARVPVPPYFPDTPVVRDAIARMYTNIETNDRWLAEILQQLEEDGLADNTVVFHWSDHGPLPRGKRWPYDSGIHVPLIIRWPTRLDPGSVSGRLISTVDLGPTVLSLAGVPIPYHVQGEAFLGEQEKKPREYVFASRDRHDEAYDMVRAARDKRMKYMRHYRPDLPYLLWIPYRNRHPILKEMWRLHAAGELSGPQRAMFQPRPAEELYDTENDPYELTNLVDDPSYAGDLSRMRDALDAWIDRVGDLGRLSEAEMVSSWYPGGIQPVTAAPIFVPITPEAPGLLPSAHGGPLPAPALIQIHCATQGASIAYTFEEGDEVRWLLYSEPIRLDPGETTLRAKAIRVGYEESTEISTIFCVDR